MKKILLLGGSAQQTVAIETAKRLGYYTVLCDYLSDNPGQYAADKFYLISTTDKEAVLKVAEDEEVDGALAYASDPAAPTAAYVSEKLGLCTNSYDSVSTLCDKNKFRKFLSENGFNTPKAYAYKNTEEAVRLEGNMELPVIVKPVDSSGSKGVTVLRSWDGLKNAIDFAFSFSRSHQIIAEEFIEKKHPYLVGGDIFISDGKVILWGLLNCHRDGSANPLVPVGKSYPPELPDEDIRNVKAVLQSMVDKLDIRFGAMNVELIIDNKNRVWPIDVGPRSGGNMIPDLLGMIFNVDAAEMCVKAAMGERIDIEVKKDGFFYATHNLHSTQSGIYEDICFSDEIKPFIIKKYLYKKDGDNVEFFDNASKALGVIFLRFESYEQMDRILSNIKKHITVKLKNV